MEHAFVLLAVAQSQSAMTVFLVVLPPAVVNCAILLNNLAFALLFVVHELAVVNAAVLWAELFENTLTVFLAVSELALVQMFTWMVFDTFCLLLSVVDRLTKVDFAVFSVQNIVSEIDGEINTTF